MKWGRLVKITGVGHVRIIAGSLRGSKLPVAELAGLRPSSDRVRETVFNWLQNQIAGRTVLDLFAGTGALGFEAASRGAKQVYLVEQNALAFSHLTESALRLKITNAAPIRADGVAWLKHNPELKFDLVFLDPPFNFEQWPLIWSALLPRLTPRALLYVEHSVSFEMPLPEGLQVLKSGKTQQVRYLLAGWQIPSVD